MNYDRVMGQTVRIIDVTAVGNVLLVGTDRSFTGQDGETVTPDSPRRGVPGLLAEQLFDLGLGIDHLFVHQNTVTVRRPGGWDDQSRDRVAGATTSFLNFYEGVGESEEE